MFLLELFSAPICGKMNRNEKYFCIHIRCAEDDDVELDKLDEKAT